MSLKLINREQALAPSLVLAEKLQSGMKKSFGALAHLRSIIVLFNHKPWITSHIRGLMPSEIKSYQEALARSKTHPTIVFYCIYKLIQQSQHYSSAGNSNSTPLNENHFQDITASHLLTPNYTSFDFIEVSDGDDLKVIASA